MARAGEGLTSATLLAFALSSGLAVANVYYAQPLIDRIAEEGGMDLAVAGSIIGATQVGYFLGLLLIVPLGDVLDRRRLLLVQTAVLGVALLVPVFASGSLALLSSFGAIGSLAVIAQIFVAYAADLAGDGSRGRAVGTVTTGIILGILLARTISGLLSDLVGWRSVYALSAAFTFAQLAVLFRIIPSDNRPSLPVHYGELVGSTLALFRTTGELRTRALFGFLIFTAMTLLWTPMVLPLRAPPWSLSHSEVGLFGLAGAMGAAGASFAGRLADRGLSERMTGLGLALMLASWLPIALLSKSLGWLILGVITIDFALQSVHVSNQALLHREGAGSRSRLTAAYMLAYSAGCASGSFVSTLIFDLAGWVGVCLAGSLVSLTGAIVWAGMSMTARKAYAVD